MPKLSASWWKAVFDGTVHHIEAGNHPYGTTASFRSAIYREASERGRGVTTYIDPMTQTMYVQAWDRRHGKRPERLWARTEESSLMPDSFGHRVPPIPAIQRRLEQIQAEVKAAGLDPEDIDLIQERQFCSCGLGNAQLGQVHDPSCKVWG